MHPAHPLMDKVFNLEPEEGEYRRKRDSLTAITFISDGCELDTFDEADVAHLEDEWAKEVIVSLFTGKGQFRVRIYVLVYPDYTTACERWIKYLMHYAINQTPELAPYLDESGRPNFDLNTPPISEFAGGMFKRMRQKEVDGKLALGDDGNPIWEVYVPQDFHKYPERYNFDAWQTFGIYTGMPVIREWQFQHGQIAYIRQWKHKTLWLPAAPKMPGLKISQAGKEYQDTAHSCKGFARWNSQVPSELWDSKPSAGTPMGVFLDVPAEWNRQDTRMEPCCHGLVINVGDELRMTQTDFCIRVTVP